MGTEVAVHTEAHQLQCMEIWGGNEAIENAISVPGIDIYVYSRPYLDDQSGGDIHYISMCGAGNISRFVIADVSGHGEAVSQMATTLRKIMRRHINTVDQTRFTRALNHEFSGLSDAGQFATAIMATYYAPTDHMIICNAGHPRPLWYRADLQQWELLTHDSPSVPRTKTAREVGIRNLPLGIIEPTSYEQFAIPLSKNDLLVFYTDALIESGKPQLGERGLIDLVRTIDPNRPEEFGPALRAMHEAHRGDEPLDDDMTLLVLHHNAADPPRQSFPEKARVLGRMLGLGGD